MSVNPVGRRGKRRAQSAVEMALMLPIFLTMIYGVIEGSRMAAVYVSLINATREGARVGSKPTATNAEITTAVQQNVLSFGSGLSTITPTICPSSPSMTATCAPLGSVTRSSGGALTVAVTYTFSFLPPISSVLPVGIDLDASAVAFIG
ncbi:MAG: pilus assembly protein [Chloroflexi bacterium]|nr:pilus assembly protein [Chloroflexota bacterium]